MVSHDLLPAKSGIFLDATYVPLYGSGANLKRLAPGGNSWDDKTDLGISSGVGISTKKSSSYASGGT
jgi:hypothetical protein